MAENETGKVCTEESPLSCKSEGGLLWQFSIPTVSNVMLVPEIRDKRHQRN